MLCKIADLITEVPTEDGLDHRCKDYLYSGDRGADIIIRTDLYRFNKFPLDTPRTIVAYMESAYQFYLQLLNFNGFYMHASAVVVDGKAYLFSGPSGVGKSTHVQNWLRFFGEKAYILNDDKPALRLVDGVWYAYGTPWCGKDGINRNSRVPVAGVCFLKKAEKNTIRTMDSSEAVMRILGQTIFRFPKKEYADLLIPLIDSLLKKIHVYEFENLPNMEAVLLSHKTISRNL